jgi:flagella basal body P-ring formation protein FlgA
MHILIRIIGTRSIGALMVWLAFGCINSAAASGTTVISLKEKVSVDGAIVRLGDIADIQGAEPDKLVKLAAVKIGNAPSPGRALSIRVRQVIAKLRSFGLASSDYRLSRSGGVRVLRRSAAISPETICKAVRAYIEAHSPWAAGQLTIKKIRLDRPVLVPAGEMAILVRAPKHTDWLGAIPFSVHILVRNRLAKKITVPATIEVWSDVFVAAKPLGRGQPITSDSIKIVHMNLGRAPSNAIVSKEQVLGKRVNRSIAANSILRSDQIDTPPVVKRGDLVLVVAQSQALKISIKGVAKQDGKRGEQIRVQNMRSKRIITAQVLDGQTVQVDF